MIVIFVPTNLEIFWLSRRTPNWFYQFTFSE